MIFRNEEDLSAIEYAMKNDTASHRNVRRQAHFGSGAALILVCLIIISLLCFAALSIVSAQADERLTDRYAGQVSAYYSARNLGEEFLADTDAALQKLASSCGDEASYLEQAKLLSSCVDPSSDDVPYSRELQSILANTEGLLPDKEKENPILVFSSPMSDTQNYLLVIRVRYPSKEQPDRYKILSSKVVNTASFDYDTSLDVLGHEGDNAAG